MYRHLMVPLDDSPLAPAIVHQALSLARQLGARITFFHAKEDRKTSVTALEAVILPLTLEDEPDAEGDVLAGAAEAARAAGVEHDCVTIVNDRPSEAILQTANSRGCDLIVMASRGRRGLRGLLLGSQTQNVLQNATLPVLVAAAAALEGFVASGPSEQPRQVTSP